MADNRRIIYSSYVVPQESASAAEVTGDNKRWTINKSVNKTLGGKGVITDLNKDQWSDQWCSLVKNNRNWEDYTDATDVSGNRWEDTFSQWDNKFTVSTSAIQLSRGLSTATDQDVSFLFIKNVGRQPLQVSLNGSGGNYYILIPASGGSTMLRGGDAAFHCDDIYVKTASGTTTIEYILAKK